MTPRRLLCVTSLLVFIHLLGVPHPTSSHEKPDAVLRFEILPVGEKVLLDKPIYLTFRLTNVGSKNVLANRRFYLNDIVLLEITGPSGQSLTWCGHIPQTVVSQGDFVFLAPGAHIQSAVRISCNEGKTSGFMFSVPGEYVVRGRYELPFPVDALTKAAQGAVVIKGPIEATQPIRIEIGGWPGF